MSKKNKSDVGGIVGFKSYNSTSLYIDRCANIGDITGYYTYGICKNGNIKNSYNEGTIKSNQLMYAAGIGNGGIFNCYNKGMVESTSSGGILGTSGSNLEIVNCFNNGEIQGNGVAGGIQGSGTNTVISNCYNFKDITSNNKAGGISG